MKDRQMKNRATQIFYLSFLIFVALTLRLLQVQVFQSERFQRLAAEEHQEKIFLPVIRGKIYDSHGNLLAISTTGYSVAAVPSKVADKQKTAELLSPILNLSAHSIQEDLDPSQPFVWISRKISPEKVQAVKQLSLAGIEIVEEPTGKRLYPMGELACHVLGYTGIDDQGLDGIELSYDKLLSGTPGVFHASIDGLGRVMPDGVTKMVPAVPGADLTLTVDETIQYLAQHELEKCVKSSHAKSGSIIIMNPENGEILALASYPFFDENHYAHYPAFALRNHAISDDYEPGSTFKAILAAAALDSRKVSMDEKFLSSPYIMVGGWRIGNADDGLTPENPHASLPTIIKDSLNVGAASIALKIGSSTFGNAIDRFGFNHTTGIDLPGETSGIIPDSKTWEPAQTATIGFGQGIAVTPIQMLRAYAILANGGYPVQPHLLKSYTLPNGQTVEPRDSQNQDPIISPDTTKKLSYLLSLVVKRGTGTAASIPAYTVAGKTGTAQVDENGRYLSGRYVASFIGFAPVEKPAFVMLIKVDEPNFPYWGGTVAAPLFKTVGEEVLWRYQVLPSKGMTRVGPYEVWAEEEGKKARNPG